jgi:hypothetical protein
MNNRCEQGRASLPIESAGEEEGGRLRATLP